MPAPIPPISNTNYGTINPAQFTRTGSPYTSADFFRLYSAQLFTNDFDILFGDEERRDSTIFGGASILNTIPGTSSPLFGGLGGVSVPSDIGGQGIFSTATNPYIEAIARSNLIGKKVTATNPQTKEIFSGKVNNILIENGILLIDVDGIKITPEYLIEISE